MSGETPKPCLNVYAKDALVGTLTFVQPDRCLLQYCEDWQAEGFPISPALPLDNSGSVLSATHYMRNLFPEGGAFDNLLQNNQLRRTDHQGIITAIGTDTAGLLSFSPQSKKPEENKMRRVTEHELQTRLENNEDITFWDGKYRLSLAGVQRKLNVYVDEYKHYYLVDGRKASTHILKFSSDKQPTLVVNELFCMRLARDAGLSVPPVSLKRFGRVDALLVERFDRTIKKSTANNVDYVDKRHMIDGCQWLDMPPTSKYERNYGDGRDVQHIRDGVSFPRLFELAKTTGVPIATTMKLIDWMCFNLIVGNSDAHGKNISLFVTQSGGLVVSPFYDLLSVAHEARENSDLETNLAMGVGDNFDVDNIKAYDLLSFALSVGVDDSLLARRFNRMLSRCRSCMFAIDFSKDTLLDSDIAVIESIATMINHRCEYLGKQVRLFNTVKRTAF